MNRYESYQHGVQPLGLRQLRNDTKEVEYPSVKLERSQVKGTLTEYIGFNGNQQKGFAYFDRSEDSWLFRPENGEDFIRVPFYALEMNMERELKTKEYYFEARYTGLNKEIRGKIGRVYPNKGMFRFRLENNSEIYRIKPENLEF